MQRWSCTANAGRFRACHNGKVVFSQSARTVARLGRFVAEPADHPTNEGLHQETLIRSGEMRYVPVVNLLSAKSCAVLLAPAPGQPAKRIATLGPHSGTRLSAPAGGGEWLAVELGLDEDASTDVGSCGGGRRVLQRLSGLSVFDHGFTVYDPSDVRHGVPASVPASVSVAIASERQRNGLPPVRAVAVGQAAPQEHWNPQPVRGPTESDGWQLPPRPSN